MSAPLVSVVTAAWNAHEGVQATVESVAAQSFAACEHIVVDGASDDGTPAYLDSLGERVRWISEPDHGIADALNKGVRMARGEWILVLQAGDTFADETSLSAVVPALAGDADIVSGAVMLYGAEASKILEPGSLGPRLEFKTSIPHQGAFCRRSLFERIGLFDTTIRIAMDYEFFLRARRRGARATQISQTVARMPDDGVSSQKDWPSLARRFGEERRIHLAHCPGPLMRLVYALYWPTYLAYRWSLSRMAT
ncbi:MAG: glycosyltransferase family 2 protein [Pseudomonadota bacterium]